MVNSQHLKDTFNIVTLRNKVISCLTIQPTKGTLSMNQNVRFPKNCLTYIHCLIRSLTKKMVFPPKHSQIAVTVSSMSPPDSLIWLQHCSKTILISTEITNMQFFFGLYLRIKQTHVAHNSERHFYIQVISKLNMQMGTLKVRQPNAKKY